MRVLVCGGRDYLDRARVYAVLDEMHARIPISVLIHGCFRGADLLGEGWAKSRCVPFLGVPAYWDRLGRRAGPERNGRMLRLGKPAIIVAFPGGSGTADMLEQTRELNKTSGLPAIEIKEIK